MCVVDITLLRNKHKWSTAMSLCQEQGTVLHKVDSVTLTQGYKEQVLKENCMFLNCDL